MVDLSGLLRDMSQYGVSNVTSGVQTRTSRTLKNPAVNEPNRALLMAVEGGGTDFSYELSVRDRSFGATLAGKLAARELSPKQPVEISTTEYAGQGFGFCAVEGMNICHTGLGNDMVGGSMSGGRIVFRRPENLRENGSISMIGNSCMYGATGGVLYVEGSAGQRLGVRNSGATIVTEGAGKYAFEYMTAGVGVVLGEIGSSIGAGMTGGKLFILDEDGSLDSKIYKESVIAREIDSDGEQELMAILVDYMRKTGSKKAERILGQWEEAKKHFKVMSPVSH